MVIILLCCSKLLWFLPSMEHKRIKHVRKKIWNLFGKQIKSQWLQKKKKYVIICHIHNYAEYNQQWNLCFAFNASKWHTHLEQSTLRRPGSSWGFDALLKGLTLVVDNSCQSRDSNPQPRVTIPTLYPLGHDCPRRLMNYFYDTIFVTLELAIPHSLII